VEQREDLKGLPKPSTVKASQCARSHQRAKEPRTLKTAAGYDPQTQRSNIQLIRRASFSVRGRILCVKGVVARGVLPGPEGVWHDPRPQPRSAKSRKSSTRLERTAWWGARCVLSSEHAVGGGHREKGSLKGRRSRVMGRRRWPCRSLMIPSCVGNKHVTGVMLLTYEEASLARLLVWQPAVS
jgi:hypothetical protein